MTATDELARQDAAFAERLVKRDASVLNDIRREYAAPLRRLVKRCRGPALSEQDIEEVVADSLQDTWGAFDPTRGQSVRQFFFLVGKRRMQDRLRLNMRRLNNAEELGPRYFKRDAQDNVPADARILEHEDRSVRAKTSARIMRMIDDAMLLLTERQRLAFTRRFASADGMAWARDLAGETGIAAKRWRKASDEARTRVRKHLEGNGVYYSQEGGRYEVA